ncbi:methylenetetrahydrofolate reductase [Tsukamurella sp. 8F]|uniref:methylenetetrahydrofolate reductase n=1 Tax=unclassified Tsukamurella TaxID=2633480 RepID=UPI0023B8BE37|nr:MULTISPECIES: methylenetetrahydrofolate reductase [unclassified Tsukamurella]MDF0532026.1 methylenetetrahydrofolate reductase [Tsukamurella sp. 8J]MDF0588431.1 methylenetetrahydrofolate reductase [Tsukamurella sp. 8F]
MTEPTVGARVRAQRAAGRMPFSVEFMPPRDADGEARLWRALRTFERMDPAFASMTYGAGGSTRERTVRVTGEMVATTQLLPVAHLTAVNHSVDELRQLVGAYADQGVRNLLVLRGDPPGDPLGEWVKHPRGVEYASELVALVRELGDFTVGVAAFPEGHYRATSIESDTRFLVDKLRAGADYSITQMFFEVDDYLRLRDRVAALDPEQGAKPIIPSIMPVTSLRSVSRMAELSNAKIPADIRATLQTAAGDGPEENRAAVRAAGIEIATSIAQRLIDEGTPSLHFCTLNFAKATSEVLGNLGMIPARV